ncbi:hypothetical protein HZH68_003471 [Vespula germanica]|uniref:Uncharacterized protein n=1 Tax=Vespula germanica TaxID=30212 RepID=A0A834NPB6_VESGE|nr:hypothetical protein HZH68_003471 [Vespula germanica]
MGKKRKKETLLENVQCDSSGTILNHPTPSWKDYLVRATAVTTATAAVAVDADADAVAFALALALLCSAIPQKQQRSRLPFDYKSLKAVVLTAKRSFRRLRRPSAVLPPPPLPPPPLYHHHHHHYSPHFALTTFTGFAVPSN